MASPLLEAEITVTYPDGRTVLDRARIEAGAGELVGLIGQSGSGKSTIALAILRLLDHKGARTQGTIRFAGRDLAALPEREMRAVRGREIGLVPQSPQAALNPSLRLETHLSEAWRAHSRVPWRDRKQELRNLFETLGLPDDDGFLRRYPGQVSVGQAQRVLIAMALLHRPPLLIADEPTSALDAVTQSEVIALFGRLHRELGTSILFISHDLLSVAALCHRVSILEGGRIVETGSVGEIFRNARHPYTRRLIGALPALPFGQPGPAGPQAQLTPQLAALAGKVDAADQTRYSETEVPISRPVGGLPEES